jgi:hypothetical protein
MRLDFDSCGRLGIAPIACRFGSYGENTKVPYGYRFHFFEYRYYISGTRYAVINLVKFGIKNYFIDT